MLPVSIFELMIVPESQADEVEEMKKAIIDDKHKMLRCPASYSPRVISCHDVSQTTSKYQDDEF